MTCSFPLGFARDPTCNLMHLVIQTVHFPSQWLYHIPPTLLLSNINCRPADSKVCLLCGCWKQLAFLSGRNTKLGSTTEVTLYIQQTTNKRLLWEGSQISLSLKQENALFRRTFEAFKAQQTIPPRKVNRHLLMSCH